MLIIVLLLPLAAVYLQVLGHTSEGNFQLPTLNDKLYFKDGDILLGGLFSITDRDPDRPCGERVSDFFRIDLVESMIFSIRELNQLLFPDLTIGYVIADACNKETTAALQALRFLPRSHSNKYIFHTNLTFNTSIFQSFDVVGVIGTDASFTTIPAALVLGSSHIPLISFRATSDVLSDQVLFPNFYRVVAPDQLMNEALAHYLKSERIEHFSILYDSATQFDSLVGNLNFKFCLDKILRVDERTNFTEVAKTIIERKFASRIIVILASDYLCKMISEAIHRAHYDGKFLWMGTDTWMQLIFSEDAPYGSIGVSYTGTSAKSSNYMDHLMGLYRHSDNPWLPRAVEYIMNCSNEECYKEWVKKTYNENPSLTPLIYKSVYALMKNVKKFIQHRSCFTNSSEEIEKCIQTNLENFASFLSNESRQAGHEDANFFIGNKGGGSFSFYQFVPKQRKSLLEVAQYNPKLKSVDVINDIDVSSFVFSNDAIKIQNYCFPQCRPDEHAMYKSECCYICKKCKEGQIVDSDGNGCEMCPLLYWSFFDGKNKNICLEIHPDFHTLNHPVSAILNIFALFGSLFVVAVFVWYVINGKNSLVKASSAELNYVMFLTFLTSYLSVPMLLSEPTHTTCTAGVLLFTISFNISYILMLIKAIRVYRIFTLSVQKIKLAYISSHFHLFLCSAFFFVELLRFMVTSYFFPILTTLHQPEKNVMYVEKVCKIPNIHLVYFFIVDFILLLLCSLFAYKTQSLPSKFKESRYVSTCVMTTLVIWIAFLPAYFTAVFHKTRVLYFVFAVLMNNNVALYLLFVSRMIMVEYLKGDGWFFVIIDQFCF